MLDAAQTLGDERDIWIRSLFGVCLTDLLVGTAAAGIA